MSGGSSLVLGPDKSQGSVLLVVEVRQPGDDAEEDEGEEEEAESGIFLARRFKDLCSGAELTHPFSLSRLTRPFFPFPHGCPWMAVFAGACLH